MGSLEEPQHGILHFGTPDNSITARQRGFFAFPSYKSVDKVSVPLLDARTGRNVVQGPDGLDVQGFAFLDHRSALAGPDKWFLNDNIEDVYLRECEDLILEVTGAKHAVASNCSLRRRTVSALTEPNFFVPKGGEIDQNLAKIPRDRCTGMWW